MSLWRRSVPLFGNSFRKAKGFFFFHRILPLSTHWLVFCILFASRLKPNLCINGKSNLDNSVCFPRLSTPTVPSGVTLPLGLVIFAVTLMRKVLNFRADPVHPSVITLAVCLIDICYLPASVPATLVNVSETWKPFPTPASPCSSDSLWLNWHGVCPAGSHGLWWLCTCLLVFTLVACHEQHGWFAVGRISMAVWLGECLGTCSPNVSLSHQQSITAQHLGATGALLPRLLLQQKLLSTWITIWFEWACSWVDPRFLGVPGDPLL